MQLNAAMGPNSQSMSKTTPEIVVIGGGTGSSVVLSGLKRRNVNLTAIVTAFDSGGSSGRLREEFGHLSVGDIRACLVALAEDSSETEAFRLATHYRFSDESSLNGHNLGNLFLSALTVMHSDLEVAVQMMSSMLRIKGQVIPVSLGSADLCAELVDGSVLRGEATIDLRRFDPPPIRRVYLDGAAEANARAIEAIRKADAVVLGPGDLYTSVVPNLLVEGVVDAIRESGAQTIFVCNVMTKHGETDGFGPVDFVREISNYLGQRRVDSVLISNDPVPAEIQQLYSTVKAAPVVLTEDDKADLTAWSRRHVSTPLTQVGIPEGEDEPRVRHDPYLLAEAVLDLVRSYQDQQANTVTGSELSRVAD